MCCLKTDKGSFVVSKYNTFDKKVKEKTDREYSCSIYVEFKPDISVVGKYKRICLVQAVKDNITIYKLTERQEKTKIAETESHVLQNKTAGFNERLTENGWAIDQQIYESGCSPLQLCNLDSRYTECRLPGATAYRDHSPADKCKKEDLGYVQNYVAADSALNSAILSDQPNALYLWGQKKVPHGSLDFEIVAMGEKEDGTKEYLASLFWGWEINGITFQKNGEVRCQMKSEVPQSTPDIYSPTLIRKELRASNQPSIDFMEAAKKWNAMVQKHLIVETGITAFILPEK